MLADVRADRDEHRIEAAGLAFSATISVDLVVQHDPHAHRFDAGDLRQQVGARQAIGGDAEMQHAAGQRARLVDLDLLAEPRQMIGGRQPARPGADHQDALARGGRDGTRPAFARRHVAEEALDRVDRHGGVQLARDCRRFRTGDSRPGHASPAADCRPSAFPRPRGSRPPAPGPARPGCSRRPGRRGCRAAAARHSSAGGCGMVPAPWRSVRSTTGVRSWACRGTAASVH